MTTWPLPEANPADVGLDPERLSRVDALLQRLIDDRIIAGAVTAAACKGNLVHKVCHGMRDMEAGLPMEEDTLFRIYSMTKPITCTAVLALYEEGYFLLDWPVKRFLPEFGNMQVREADDRGQERLLPAHRDITIHDVMTHTAGLDYNTWHHAESSGMSLADVVREIAQQPLLGHPGEVWRYSAANDVLGRLVEVVAGMPFDVFLQKRIFDPLEMRDTSFWIPDTDRPRLATLYEHDEQGRIKKREKEDRSYFKRPAAPSGGGGLISSTSDYLRFALMLLGGGALGRTRILGRKTVELMRQDHLPPGHGPIQPYKFSYGLGVSVLRSLGEKQGMGSVGEFGWGGAASTDCWIDPVEDMVTLVMMQLRPNGEQFITKRVKDAFYQALV